MKTYDRETRRSRHDHEFGDDWVAPPPEPPPHWADRVADWANNSAGAQYVGGRAIDAFEAISDAPRRLWGWLTEPSPLITRTTLFFWACCIVFPLFAGPLVVGALRRGGEDEKIVKQAYTVSTGPRVTGNLFGDTMSGTLTTSTGVITSTEAVPSCPSCMGVFLNDSYIGPEEIE